MAAAMVAVPIVVTVAIRRPEIITGAASGNSTMRRIWPFRHSHRDRRFAHRRIHAQNARHRVAQNRQQRINHQRHNRRMLPDAADKRNRDQKAEQRQARNGLPDVRDPDRDAAASVHSPRSQRPAESQ